MRPGGGEGEGRVANHRLDSCELLILAVASLIARDCRHAALGLASPQPVASVPGRW